MMCRIVTHLLLLAVGLRFVAVAASTESATHDSAIAEAVAAAKGPLLREIQILKELMHIHESRHDTLEAATEQFRIQAKSLKGQLDEGRVRCEAAAEEFKIQAQLLQGQVGEEKVRYEMLVATTAAREVRLQDQLQALEKRLARSDYNNTLLQQSLDKAKVAARAKDSRHENEIKLRQQDSKNLQTLLRNQRAQFLEVSQELKQRDLDLLNAKTLYFGLRQELFNANEKLRETEGKQNSNQFSHSWHSLLETDEAVSVRERWRAFSDWCRDAGFDTLVLQINQFTESTKAKAKAVAEAVLPSHSTVDGIETAASQMTHYFSPIISNFVSTCEVALTSLPWYHEIQKALIGLFESIADVVSRFCMLQEGGNPRSVLFSIAMFTKQYSLPAVLMIEAYIAFSFLKFVVESTIKYRQRRKTRMPPPGSLLSRAQSGSRHNFMS